MASRRGEDWAKRHSGACEARTRNLERLANPKGDRVKITMSGKFLPYKYYGNSADSQEYGYKEP